ncbi:MAG: hypothetical protein GY941_16410 [Planctomycetes bacterium]|nr:hypothetical protein [Planctomycetota bacterium]
MSNEKRKALIDADLLKYMAGFACQKEIWTHEGTGEFFEGKLAAKQWWKEIFEGDWDEEAWSFEVEIKPWIECKRIILLKVGEIMHQADCSELLMCLSPSKTFRDEVAVTRPYKGNRKDHKPVYAEDIVHYIKNEFAFEVGDNVEADDVMGMHQTTSTVIASYDKDMDMIPGLHYNFKDGIFYEQDPFSADDRFYTQLIAGDSTDNIQGIPKWGEKKASKLVEAFGGDKMELAVEIKHMYNDAYGDEDGEAVMKEMAALVWILRHGETPRTARWREMLIL